MQRLGVTAVLFFVSSISYADLVKDQVLTIDGLDRTYDMYLPNKEVSGPRPLS